MSFTGILGKDNSVLGSTFVLGIVDSFELGSISYLVHSITSRQIRIQYGLSVNESSLFIQSYQLQSTYFVPNIIDVKFDDSDQRSVILYLDNDLLFDAEYSVSVNGVASNSNIGVISSPTIFKNNCHAPPIASFACLGRKSTIDLVFNKEVGPYSSPVASIRVKGTLGPSASLTPTSWVAEQIPLNVLRFEISSPITAGSEFEIDYSNVSTISGNLGDGSVPLFLKLNVPAPYNESSISQIQLIKSSITKVIEYSKLTCIRSYFNVLTDRPSLLNLSNWSFKLLGPHVRSDSINSVSEPNSTDLTSLVDLLNNIKSVLNSHIKEAASHYFVDSFQVTQPNAVDYDSAIVLYNDILNVYTSHSQSPSHIYDDSSFLNQIEVNNISDLILNANQLRKVYSDHITPTRALDFSSSLPFGPIYDISSPGYTSPHHGPFKYAVDVYLSSSIREADIQVTCNNIFDSQLSSSTNSSNETGFIICEKYFNGESISYAEPISDLGVKLHYENQIDFNETLSIKNEDGLSSFIQSIESETDLNRIPQLLNEIVYSYDIHINQAGHQIIEPVYTVVPSDYLYTNDLGSMISCANNIKTKINGHFTGSAHIDFDQIINEVAYDENSLKVLVFKLIGKLNQHNMSGASESPIGVIPKLHGFHSYPGPVILSSSYFTNSLVKFDKVKDGEIYLMSGFLNSIKNSTKFNRIDSFPLVLDSSFEGVSEKPSLSSAVPLNALFDRSDLYGNQRISFNNDQIKIWFSKPMYQTELDNTNVVVTGGSIMVNDYKWTSPQTIILNVENMQKISYNVSVVGLTDTSGNTTY